MRGLLILAIHLRKLLGPGGVRALAAERLLLKLQMHITKLGALIKPATLLKFHKALVERKYRLLSSASSHRGKPGPKGPSVQFIPAIVEMKRRNAPFGCVRIAQQISHVFGLEIDKDVVQRVLAKHYRPGDAGTTSPSWLTLIAQAKDSHP